MCSVHWLYVCLSFSKTPTSRPAKAGTRFCRADQPSFLFPQCFCFVSWSNTLDLWKFLPSVCIAHVEYFRKLPCNCELNLEIKCFFSCVFPCSISVCSIRIALFHLSSAEGERELSIRYVRESYLLDKILILGLTSCISPNTVMFAKLSVGRK